MAKDQFDVLVRDRWHGEQSLLWQFFHATVHVVFW
jgi:hypothetical protein